MIKKKTCSYSFKTGPDAGHRCNRPVHTDGMCCGHYRRKQDGGDMEELSGKPLRTRSTNGGALAAETMARLDRVAAVMRLSRSELLARIAEEWLAGLVR